MTESSLSPNPLPSQTAPMATDPKAPPTVTPPMTGDKGVGFVTGQGRGPKQTGKGQGK